MAQWDDSENYYDQPYGGGAPAPDIWGGLGVTARQAQIDQWYQQYLGRSGTQAEYSSHMGNPGGLAAIEALIKGSDEAKARSAPKPLDPAPPPPAPTPTPTPAPAPAPGPAPPPAPGPAPAPPPSSPTPPPNAPGPTPNLPSYTPPPAYAPPPAFSYKDFTPTTADDVLNDPGYQFELGQGSQAMQQSAAARGVLNTGGTLKDLIGFGQNLASTKFGEADSRNRQNYMLGRTNALDTYNTNYGTQYKDPYSINYASQYTDPFAMNTQTAMNAYGAAANNYGLAQSNNQFNAGLATNQDQFGRSLNQNQGQFSSSLDFQKWIQNYKMNVLDPFDMKYKIASNY